MGEARRDLAQAGDLQLAEAHGIRERGLLVEGPDAGTDGELPGETSAAACAFGFVDCAPPAAESGTGVFVVPPRNSDGTAAAAGDRYPFSAFVTG